MNNYFTISEFAKLRNININSLRYYEKLGILKPAYIDKKNNYRYYTSEQLSVLDKIILCINLGIPLKEMVKYIDYDGSVQSQKLLERGKTEAKNKINDMLNNLNFIEYSLKNIESNKEFADQKGVYVRTLDERRIITSDYYVELMDVKDILGEVALLYKTAQENKLFPILPAGQLLEIHPSKKMRYRLFLEIIERTKEHPNIITIPQGSYSCSQIELTATTDLSEIINTNWGTQEEMTIIVHNIILEKYSYGTRPTELQKKIY